MEMSQTIGALAKALASAQATIGGAVKGNVNPAFKSKYADLSAVWDAWQAVGPAKGLAVSQLPGVMTDGKVTLTTILLHESGEWMRETMSIPVTKADAQGSGSGLTYARRYALSALVGIAPEDDDGNAAVAKPAVRSVHPPTNTNPEKTDPGGEDDLAEKFKAWADAERQKIETAEFDREMLAQWDAANRKYFKKCEQHAPDALALLQTTIEMRHAALDAFNPHVGG
jgi:hypothetical protein